MELGKGKEDYDSTDLKRLSWSTMLCNQVSSPYGSGNTPRLAAKISDIFDRDERTLPQQRLV